MLAPFVMAMLQTATLSRIDIQTNYTRSDSGATAFAEALALIPILPLNRYRDSLPLTPDEIVERAYHLSTRAMAQSLGSAYEATLAEALVDRIVKFNGLQRGVRVTRGRVVYCPVLPAKGNRVLADYVVVEQRANGVIVGDKHVHATEEREEPFRSVVRIFDAEGILESTTATALGTSEIGEVRLSAENAGDIQQAEFEEFLSHGDWQLIERELADSAHPVYLFIADVGYPSLADCQRSRRALKRLIAAAYSGERRAYDSDIDESCAGVDTASAKHARVIHRSLRPLEQRDRYSRVSVVYVPLLALPGQDTEIRELLRMQFALGRTGSVRDAKEYENIQAETAAAFENVGTALAADGTMIIDRALVNALWTLGWAAAKKDSTFAIFSLSWWAPARARLSGPPQSSRQGTRSLAFVAAGNEDRDVYPAQDSLRRDFISITNSSRDFVGVVNAVERAERFDPICRSSYPHFSGLTEAPMLFAFDGRTEQDADVNCGTSFATPRVAWLAAASLGRVTMANEGDLRIAMLQRLGLDPRSARGLGDLKVIVSKLFDSHP